MKWCQSRESTLKKVFNTWKISKEIEKNSNKKTFFRFTNLFRRLIYLILVLQSRCPEIYNPFFKQTVNRGPNSCNHVYTLQLWNLYFFVKWKKKKKNCSASGVIHQNALPRPNEVLPFTNHSQLNNWLEFLFAKQTSLIRAQISLSFYGWFSFLSFYLLNFFFFVFVFVFAKEIFHKSLQNEELQPVSVDGQCHCDFQTKCASIVNEIYSVWISSGWDFFFSSFLLRWIWI